MLPFQFTFCTLLAIVVDTNAIQHKNDVTTIQWTSGLSASLDEAGYRAVASLMTNGEMGHFVKRVIKAHHATVTDGDMLRGVLPYHSGVKSTQFYASLLQDLARADWVSGFKLGFGATAAFDEAGYQDVVSMRSNSQMEKFIRRLLKAHGATVNDEDKLGGMIPYHSGNKASQHFDQLIVELSQAGWVSKFAMAEGVSDSPEAAPRESNIGLVGTLDEDGFNSVAALKHDGAMGTFIRRLVKKLGGKVTDEDDLHGFVGYYSGATKPGQSFEKLMEEISQRNWTSGVVLLQQNAPKNEVGDAVSGSVSGLSASLDEAGYQAIAALKKNGEMGRLVKRVVKAHHANVTNEDMLHGMVPYHSGVKSTQFYASLLQDLAKADWLSGFLLGFGRSATFDEVGYQDVVSMRSNRQMEEFVRRVLNAHGAIVHDEDKLNGMIPYYSGNKASQHFAQLIAELSKADWLTNFKTNGRINVGLVATLDEAGFNSVAASKHNGAMGDFIRRIVEEYGGEVTNEDELHRFAPYYSGVKVAQSFQKLMEEIAQQNWTGGIPYWWFD